MRPILALAALVALFVGGRAWTGNFAVLEPGRVYRSGQLSAGALGRAVRAHRIRTVLNLRGSNPADPWYRAERAATLAEGATQVDIHLASDMWLSREQARILVGVLDTCEYPLLIHCQWGAERTGLVSAIVELLRPGGSLAGARGQFSPYFLFVRAGDGAVMAEHLDRYQGWLEGQGQAHTPARFRHWLAEVYRPGHPSPEEWPYNPYEPLVVTRPPGRAGHSGGGVPPTIRK